jgi:hypothetical protein
VRQSTGHLYRITASIMALKLPANTPNPTGRNRKMPLLTCAHCGSTWFRIVEPRQYTKPPYFHATTRDQHRVAVCVCGQNQRPNIGWQEASGACSPNMGVPCLKGLVHRSADGQDRY